MRGLYLSTFNIVAQIGKLCDIAASSRHCSVDTYIQSDLNLFFSLPRKRMFDPMYCYIASLASYASLCIYGSNCDGKDSLL